MIMTLATLHRRKRRSMGDILDFGNDINDALGNPLGANTWTTRAARRSIRP